MLLVFIGNTEVIANSVIILFIMDIDELLCDIMTVINTNWVKSMSLEDEDEETRSDLIAQRIDTLNHHQDSPKHSSHHDLLEMAGE